MERNQAIQIVREACIAANPEILELKFGCEIKLDGQPYKVLYYDQDGKSFDGENIEFYGKTLELYSPEGEVSKYSDEEEDLIMPKTDEIEILGRPIHLADILVACDKANRNIYVHRTGIIIDFDIIRTLQDKRESGAEWNLRADSLTKQTTETLLFLAELVDKGK